MQPAATYSLIFFDTIISTAFWHSFGFKRLLGILCLVLTVGIPQPTRAVNFDENSDDFPILLNSKGNKRYSYYRNEVEIHFLVEKQPSVDSYSGIIFQIQSNKNDLYSFILDYNKEGASSIFITSSTSLFKFSLPVDTALFSAANTMHVAIDFSISKDLLTLSVADTTYRVHSLGLKVNSGYEFIFPPNMALHSRPNTVPEMLVKPLRIDTAGSQTSHRKLWFWYILILVLDGAIFLVIHIRKRIRKRQLLAKKSKAGAAIESENDFPRKSAIYLFGSFQVFDADGEDITKRFSPLLKELFLLILLNSHHKGISTQNIKDILWFDKTEKSAKNNLFVNIGKLRQQLDMVGSYELTNKTTSWEIAFNDIYVDYIDYLNHTASASNDPANSVNALVKIGSKGQLLTDCSYAWLDAFKAASTDSIFDRLNGFAQTLSPATDSNQLLNLCRVMLEFDSLNEHVVELQCRVLIAQGKHLQAKLAFEQFAREYEQLYGSKFEKTFLEIG